ncbi:hypothetical protein HPP92_019321 [Vanilla planifolia]|uniref:Uncharacterized protein n=1 Tax=Vanilla planifolia TaxID=51239 RepID=A0A835UKM5_VANPL|nr:hypothetical protein HPP92_019321 [Vanilla planifolia]
MMYVMVSLKLALETVRRFSEVKVSSLWKVVQAFQIFCYPPFKWLQRWGPLRIIVRGAQITITGDGSYIEFCTGVEVLPLLSIAKPVLLLFSIATTFSGKKNCSGATARVDDSQIQSDSVSEIPLLIFNLRNHQRMLLLNLSRRIFLEDWQLQVYGELEKQGISLPERFNVDELNRFYAAANGDLANLLSSSRSPFVGGNYNILSSHELEVWSHLVFWHGFDVMLRPCLVIRLGLAWSTLAPDERPRFAQAIVSQIDHGVLNLIDENDSKSQY